MLVYRVASKEEMNIIFNSKDFSGIGEYIKIGDIILINIEYIKNIFIFLEIG